MAVNSITSVSSVAVSQESTTEAALSIPKEASVSGSSTATTSPAESVLTGTVSAVTSTTSVTSP